MELNLGTAMAQNHFGILDGYKRSGLNFGVHGEKVDDVAELVEYGQELRLRASTAIVSDAE